MASEQNPFPVVLRLVKSILRYTLLLVVVGLIFFAINRVMIGKYKYEAAPDTDTLIIGPSILKSSVDPSIIPHSENISQDEEMYPMSYIKLAEILPRNPQIKQVILAYSPPLIATKMDALAFSNPLFEQEIIRRLHPISSPSDYHDWPITQKTMYQVFFQNYALPNTSYIKQVFKGDKTDQENPRLPYIGNFKSKKASKLKESQARLLRRVTPRNDVEKKVSPFLTKGLQDIIDLCAERKIKLILLGPPLHESIHNIVPPAVRKEYKRLAAELPSDNIYVLDLTDIEIPDDHFFNASHINKRGSVVVSDTLYHWMNDHNLIND